MQLAEKFSKPENWDKCADGTGYVMYCGCNDWENGATAAAVVFPSDEANRRIWFKIKFPEDCVVDSGKSGGSKDENSARCRKHAEKAWRAWIRAAREAHKNRNHGSRSWKDAFKTALHSKEMQAYVKEHGEEATKWDDVRESRARYIVTALLEVEDDVDPESYLSGLEPDIEYRLKSGPLTLVSPDSPGDGTTAPCRVVLHQSHSSSPGREEWVTHLENRQVGGTFWGHYTRSYPEALEDYKKRCQELGVNWQMSTIDEHG